MNKYSFLVVSFSVSLISAFTFASLKASAQCGWLDPTCPPSQWTKPPITIPGSQPGTESEVGCPQCAVSTSCASIGSKFKNGSLTTYWDNGNKYEEQVFFTTSNGVSYIRWLNSKDWFPLILSSQKFQFKRGNNWQDYTGTCQSGNGFFVSGTMFSHPDQVRGRFHLNLFN